MVKALEIFICEYITLFNIKIFAFLAKILPEMKPNISIFFPAYNEEANIRALLEKATAIIRGIADNYELIVVVYEGSTDNTVNIVKYLSSKDAHINLVIQPRDKKGIGYAIRLGFESAKYDNIFYTDSDNQFDLDEIKNFLPYIKEHDVIAGYRESRKDPMLRIFTAKVYNLIVRLLFGVKERDVDCAFRFVNKRVFSKVKLICNLGLGTTELLVKARKYGFKIKQIPVVHYPRKAGSSVFEGKLINLPKPKVVFDLIREMRVLWKDIHNADFGVRSAE